VKFAGKALLKLEGLRAASTNGRNGRIK